MVSARFKRFYKTVAVEPAAGALNHAGFNVTLDGREIKTPAKAKMTLPRSALADALAEEWQAQGEEVEIHAMPLTGLVWTAIDLVRPHREQIVDQMAAYAAHDLVCYRAEAPAELLAVQQDLWRPLLDWAARTYDAQLTVTSGIVSVQQPPESLAGLRGAAAAKDDFVLSALRTAAAAAGSLVIGLALVDGRIDAEAAFAAAELDETYQIERWGEDPEAVRRRAAVKADLEAAARLIALLRI